MRFRSSDTTPRRTRSRRRSPKRLLDRLANEAFECYEAWRSECAVLEAAYRRWLQAPRSDAAFAYAAYTAALEREECAAGRYRTVVNQAEDLLPKGEWSSRP
jgi:hypothetical protein